MARASDKERLARLLESEMAGQADVPARIEALKRFHVQALAEAERRFTGAQRGLRCGRFLCRATDAVLAAVRECLDGEEADLCWAAAGGFGRAVMSPGSTARLLLLHSSPDPARPAAVANRARELLAQALPRFTVSLATVPGTVALMARSALQASALLETRSLGGSRSLYRQFRRAVVEDFLVASWGTFGEQALAESLARRDPYTGSPYRTELNLKESAGCLRDVGTLQKLRGALVLVPDLDRFWEGLGGERDGLLLARERRSLAEALGFLLAVRNQLHFTAGPESDVLEMRAQRPVAAALGYEDEDGKEGSAVARLMHDLFGHTGSVARMLQTVQERFAHLRAVAWERPKPLHRRALEDGFVEVEGKICNASRPPFEKDSGARRMIEAFLLSQRRHRPVSRELLDQVAESLHLVDESFRADRRASSLFMDLLAGSVGVAERLAWMRDCGLLQRYIPELAPVINLVRYSESSDYTVGEHSLEALRVVDDLGHTRDESELPQREVLSQVERPDLLRLALLLHHAGDGGPGTVQRVGRRMGLPTGEVETVGLLVRERNLMTALADRHELDDTAAWRRAADRVGSAERLRMLYLLTYADSRAAGRIGWFSWRDALLYEVYQKLLALLAPSAAARATPEYFRSRLPELAAEAGLTEAAEKLTANAPERYMIEVSADDAMEHLRLTEKLRCAPGALSVTMERGCARVWFCTSDVPARFSQIAGVLTAHGLNILSARAFTLADGTVLDRFMVHGHRQATSADPAFWRQVESTFTASIRGELDLDGLVARRLEHREERPAAESRRELTSIHFDNESSPRFTIVDIVTWDRLGLLYSVSKALSRSGANIESAMVATRLDLAEDVFYVSDKETGGRIEAQSRLENVRKLLTAAAEGP